MDRQIIGYVRVSTIEQNEDRQELKGCDIRLIDKCSGSIPFKQRKSGSQVLKKAQEGYIKELRVHSIDRLGRNTLDILNTIQELTDLGVNVVAEKQGLQTLREGKEEPLTKMLLSILATLSEWELQLIKERREEGIAQAKQRGVYKTNGKKPETIQEFISKKQNAECLKYLKQGNSLREASRQSKVSLGTAQKISKYIQEGILS